MCLDVFGKILKNKNNRNNIAMFMFNEYKICYVNKK